VAVITRFSPWLLTCRFTAPLVTTKTINHHGAEDQQKQHMDSPCAIDQTHFPSLVSEDHGKRIDDKGFEYCEHLFQQFRCGEITRCKGVIESSLATSVFDALVSALLQ